ncbi:hypothetical protein niasHS_008246 [Heterodera schachtii]|uniref:Uncharacterized protein n=1 Tax=Heterodera schachtii TaxID=97005 RepID=A0ABD2IXA3_HETSC
MSQDLFGHSKSEEWKDSDETGNDSDKLSQMYVGIRPVDKCLRIAYAKAMDMKHQKVVVMVENDNDFRTYDTKEVPVGEIIKFERIERHRADAGAIAEQFFRSCSTVEKSADGWDTAENYNDGWATGDRSDVVGGFFGGLDAAEEFDDRNVSEKSADDRNLSEKSDDRSNSGNSTDWWGTGENSSDAWSTAGNANDGWGAAEESDAGRWGAAEQFANRRGAARQIFGNVRHPNNDTGTARRFFGTAGHPTNGRGADGRFFGTAGHPIGGRGASGRFFGTAKHPTTGKGAAGQSFDGWSAAKRESVRHNLANAPKKPPVPAKSAFVVCCRACGEPVFLLRKAWSFATGLP